MAIPIAFKKGLVGGVLAAILVSFGMSGSLVTPGMLGGQIIYSDARRIGRLREGMYGAVGEAVVQLAALARSRGVGLPECVPARSYEKLPGETFEPFRENSK